MRGSAGTVALVLASVFLLFAAWLLAGRTNPAVDQAIASLGEDPNPGVTGPDARSLVGRADALLQGLTKDADRQAPIVPGETVLARSAPDDTPAEERGDPPGVADLSGRIDGSSIELTWRAKGGEPAEGWLVERLAPGGEVLFRKNLPPESLRYRDGPVDAIQGIRIYRVTARGHDGTVAGLQQKKVSFRQAFQVTFLEGRAGGTARFRVNWDRAGQQVSEEFDVAAGGAIGGPVPGKKDRPALDFGTGWRFIGFAGRRLVTTREAGVPRFSPDGSLQRDPDTGEPVLEERKMPVADVVVGAEVLLLREDGKVGRVWLEKAR